jgi:hypothetical protein
MTTANGDCRPLRRSITNISAALAGEKIISSIFSRFYYRSLPLDAFFVG